jgi:hypothetical protein
VAAFLRACEDDSLEVFGWEAWVIDHYWSFDANMPIHSPGRWCGFIPTAAGWAVVGGGNPLKEIPEIAIDPPWSEFIRFNITIDC